MQSTAYEILKWWLPIITAFTLVIKGWSTVVKSVTEWAEKLLNNHLHHIQDNTAEAAELLRDTHAEFKTLRADQATAFADSRRDMMAFMDANNKIQQSILLNLEVLRDRDRA
jgi:hypothetical protein